MGIKGLTKLLSEIGPKSFKEQPLDSYFGRIVAVDASMALYQFLIAVRQDGINGQLATDTGEVTSHLIGMFYRTIRMMDNGIKPVYVFDGKPPELKSKELEKRKINRDKAQTELKKAEEEENEEKQVQMEKRLVKVNQQHVEEVQQLLNLLGIPWIQASGEAEAQCAEMCRLNLVYGTATEDMDALTFGSPRLIRHLTYSEARKIPICEFELNKILSDLNISMNEFIDICILCGCDYIPSIRGIGPKKAYQLIKKHKNIENLIKILDKKRYTIPENFLYEKARELFKKPDIIDCKNIKLEWKKPDEKGIIDYLVNKKGFNLDRVQNGLNRLIQSKDKSSQKRLDNYFKALPAPPPPPSPSTPSSIIGKKRKDILSKKEQPNKKKLKIITPIKK